MKFHSNTYDVASTSRNHYFLNRFHYERKKSGLNYKLYAARKLLIAFLIILVLSISVESGDYESPNQILRLGKLQLHL